MIFPVNKIINGFKLVVSIPTLRTLSAPVNPKTTKAAAGYVSAEDTEVSSTKLDRWNVTVGYDYSLSKRTSVYTAATYLEDTYKTANEDDHKPNACEVMVGLIHKF